MLSLTYKPNSSLFEVGEVLFFGVVGAIFLALEFPVAPIVLGYVLGPLVEENFRRALLLSRGAEFGSADAAAFTRAGDVRIRGRSDA